MVSIDMCGTGNQIALLRDQIGLTNQDIADYLGFTSRNTVYRWLHGETLPTVDHFVMLSELFHVSVDDLIVRQYM